jgi:hypothetical protein
MKTPDIVKALRKVALALPGVEEGVACAGTPIEKSTCRVKKKAFLFLGNKDGGFDVMVKLDASLADARERAAKEPGRYKAGAGGWVSAKFARGEAPPRGLLERWIVESHGVLADGEGGAKAKAKAKAKTR